MSKMIISDTEKNCFIKAGIERKKMVKNAISITKLQKKGKKLPRSYSASMYQKAMSKLSFHERGILLYSKFRA